MTEQWITSVGIDVGTSTTKIMVSQLRLGQMNGKFSLPRVEIVERRIRYASPVYPTPLRHEDEIDMEAIYAILLAEYGRAGLRMTDVKSGAVIITGESAARKNAQTMVHLLAERSGDFVVAAAGADLEGVLAGKGSGAEARSNDIRGVVANIDIGGGTANTAFFHRGKAIGTVAFHIGGRLIRLREDGEIRYVSPHLQSWLSDNGFRVLPGEIVTYGQLKEIAMLVIQDMLSYLAGQACTPAFSHLFVGARPDSLPRIDEMMISGGVGHLMSGPGPTNLEQTAVYGDFGPLLAGVLRERSGRSPFRFVPSEQTIRATVIGAGMQSTEISGSTVFLDPDMLPVRNVPVLVLELEEGDVSAETPVMNKVAALMETGLRLFDPAVSPPFAFALRGLRHCTYAQLQHLSDALSVVYRQKLAGSRLMVVICENDMAKALGQSLSIRCRNEPRIICIDQIRVEHGDYIDLGEPISGTVIPVVVKSLAFTTI